MTVFGRHYTVEHLPNGLYRVVDRGCKSWGTFEPSGKARGGDLGYSMSRSTAREIISRYQAARVRPSASGV